MRRRIFTKSWPCENQIKIRVPILNDTLFEQPPEHAKIWRYMDVSKLAALLATHALFFVRADTFDDKWEGTVSPNDLTAWGNMVVAREESQENRDKLIRNYPLIFQKSRQHTYISCWHQNDGESAAMWKLYLKSGEGIALQTSFGLLRSELDQSTRPIRIGRVRYCDYKKDSIPGGQPRKIGVAYVSGLFAPFIHKRLGFLHENEVRAVFQDSYNSVDDLPESEFGLPVTVNVEKLVENVYVAPGTPAWLRDTVQSVLNKFEIDLRIQPSEFDEPPPCQAQPSRHAASPSGGTQSVSLFCLYAVNTFPFVSGNRNAATAMVA
jgi:hypothetical protein